MASREMKTYYPTNDEESKTVTFRELYERAAKAKFGRNITILRSQFVRDKVKNIDFDWSVVDREAEPREVTRTIVDINMKE